MKDHHRQLYSAQVLYINLFKKLFTCFTTKPQTNILQYYSICHAFQKKFLNSVLNIQIELSKTYLNWFLCPELRSRIHERKISLRFPGIIFRVLRLEVSVQIFKTKGLGYGFLSGFPPLSFFFFLLCTVTLPNKYVGGCVSLKGQCHEIFCFWFFS